MLVTTPNSVSIDNVKRFIDLLRDSDYKYLLTRTVLLWNDAAPGNEVVINVDATKNVLVRELSPQNDPSTCLVDIPLDPHLATGERSTCLCCARTPGGNSSGPPHC